MARKHPNGEELRFHGAVGTAIRRAREDAGLSRTELERKLGLSAQALQHIEGGQPCPLYTLARIAEHLDLTLDELVPVEVDA